MRTGPPAWAFVLSALLPAALSSQEVPVPDLGSVSERVAAAIGKAAEAVREETGDGTAWGRYGMVLHAHGFYREAEEAYRVGVELDPEEARWPYYLARLLEREAPAEALPWLERTVRLKGDYAPARIRLAEALEILGRRDEAYQQYAEAQRLDRSDPLAPLGLGRIALQRGEVEEAIRHLERAYELAPHVQAIVATLARAYQRAGRRDLARARAEEARDLPAMMHHRDPLRAEIDNLAVDAQSFLRRAKTYKEVGRPRDALALLEEILSVEPDLAEGHFLEAAIHDELGEPVEAMRSARAALDADPGLVGARSLMAGALFKLQRFDEAREEARRVLAEDPDHLHMLLLSGMLAGREGRLEAMLAHLDRAYEMRSRDPALRPLLSRVLLDIAESFASAGHFREAAKRMEQVLRVAEEAGASAETLDRHRRRLELYRSRSGS